MSSSGNQAYLEGKLWELCQGPVTTTRDTRKNGPWPYFVVLSPRYIKLQSGADDHQLATGPCRSVRILGWPSNSLQPMFAPEEHSNKLLTIFHQNLYKWMLSRGWQLVPKTSPEARERVVPPTGEHYLMRAPAR